MSTLSDLLGIPHFTTSNGGTVRTDFLLAVAYALKIEVPRGIVKDELIRILWEAANRAPMPGDRLSRGGTVTNIVLREIIDGVAINKLGAPEPPNGLHGVESSLAALQDERKRQVRELAIREGQDAFRAVVLDAYHSTCAVTGTDVPAALEAAHIVPYRGPRSSVVTNGLCLRRDIHALFDRGMLAIDERGYNVLLNPVLMNSPTYSVLAGKRISMPNVITKRPDDKALCSHRLWTGLG